MFDWCALIRNCFFTSIQVMTMVVDTQVQSTCVRLATTMAWVGTVRAGQPQELGMLLLDTEPTDTQGM